jgi:hypothetical protein
MTTFTALEQRFTFTGDPTWVARFDDLYAACRTDADGPAEVELGFRAAGPDVEVGLLRDGELVLQAPSAAALVERVVWEINQLAWESAPVLLHGAAVVIDAGAVALCGPSGAGKSTLAAALVQRGGGYLSDEIVALRGVEIDPYPKPISLRVADREPEIDGDRALLALRPEPAASAAPVGMIVLVDHDAAAAPMLRETARADALVALGAHVHRFDEHGGVALRALGEAVARSRCVTLRAGDLDLTCALLFAAATEPAARGTVATRSTGAHTTVVLDGEAVVLDERTGRVHRLNSSATRIWTQLDGARSRDDIAAALGAPVAEVDAFLAELQRVGLVA